MARDFESTASEYFTNTADTPPIAALGFSFFCWVNRESSATNMAMGGVGGGSAGTSTELRGTSGNAVQFRIQNGTTADTSTTMTNGVWHSCLARATGGGAIEVTLDAGGSATNTGATFPSVDQTRIGVRAGGSATLPWDGLIAEWAMWNTDLNDGEDAALAAGYSPLFIRPSSLVFYEPMWRGVDLIDIVGGFRLTDTNTVGIAAHPRIIYPTSPRVATAPSSAAAATATVLPRRAFVPHILM